MKLRFLFAILLIAGMLGLTASIAGAQSSPAAQGKTLRVATKPLVPFVFKQDGKLVGFSIDLWEAIAQMEGFNYQWVEVGSVTQQLEAVENGQADAAIAGISMTPEREALIDFSHPYFDSGLLILTTEHGSSSFDAVLGVIFSPTLMKILGLGLLTLLVMANIIWLVERGANPRMPKAYLPGIWEAVWWSLSTIATLEYGDKEKPKSVFRRLLAMFWVVLGIVLIAQFTAAITATLTVEQITGDIQGSADLPGRSIATVTGSTSAEYLDQEGLGFTGVDKIEEAYSLLEDGSVDAVVYDAPVLLYYALKEGRGRVHTVGSIFQDETYGIALPTGSSLREPINDALLELKQNGTYATIYAKWFGSDQ